MGRGSTYDEGLACSFPIRAAERRAERERALDRSRPVPSSLPRRLRPEELGAHLDRLYRAAWALCGSHEDAEDLVQDTLTRVLARPRMLRGTTIAYLLRALRNTFLDIKRTSARRPTTQELADEDRLIDRGQADPGEQVVQHDALFSAIAALPADYRDALVAVDVVGLSYREAAQLLHAREETIGTRLFRARRQVAQGFQPSPPTPAQEAGGDLVPA